MSLSLRHLRYVVEVAERGSITEASHELNVSQPAISAAIKGLESDFGYALFVRNPPRGLSLTPSGRTFVNRARQLLDEVREFQRDATGLGRQLAGVVHVGVYFITAPYLVPPVFRRMHSRYPNISISLREGDMVEVVSHLKSGAIDIALTYDSYVDPTITYDRLFDVQPHVILSASHPLARTRSISLAQLTEAPMVSLDLPVAQEYFQSLFTLHGLQPTIRYRLKTFELVRSVVAAGAGYSFGLLPIRTEHTYDGSKLVQRPLKESVPHPGVCLAFMQRSLRTRTVDAFAEVCRQVLKA